MYLTDYDLDTLIDSLISRLRMGCKDKAYTQGLKDYFEEQRRQREESGARFATQESPQYEMRHSIED